jgi:hypothetical protein
VRICFIHAGPVASLHFDLLILAVKLVRTVEPTRDVHVLFDGHPAMTAFQSVVDMPRVSTEVVATPFADPVASSRHLKIQVRNLVDGPLWCLDSDALAVRRFVDAHSQDRVGACLDRAGIRVPGRVSPGLWGMFSELGWSVEPTVYLNTGVLYWPDTREAEDLARHWYRYWTEWSSRFDLIDQPAFNAALAGCKTPFEVLRPEFNAMIQVSPYLQRDARILHFYAGGYASDADELAVVRSLSRQARAGDQLDLAAVAKQLVRDSLWVGQSKWAFRERRARYLLNPILEALRARRFDEAAWGAREAVRTAPWSPVGYALCLIVACRRALTVASAAGV